MNPVQEFLNEREKAIEEMSHDEELKKKSLEWMIHADKYKYTYNFKWMGRPIIKFPNDIVMQQEIMWDIKPDLIIETGIAHGGSIVFSASVLEMMGISNGHVLGIDIDIRKHNRELIETHPMMKRITMIEGSSTSENVVTQIREIVKDHKCIMVILDSLHTHEHVLKELRIYSDFVTVGSYLLLPDTFIELFPNGYFKNRPWDVGNNPMTALHVFLSENNKFLIDRERIAKLMITEGFDGYLKKIRD